MTTSAICNKGEIELQILTPVEAPVPLAEPIQVELLDSDRVTLLERTPTTVKEQLIELFHKVVQNWWKFHKDDDEVEAAPVAGAPATKRLPIGLKEYATYLLGVTFILINIYLFKWKNATPFLAQTVTGTLIDFTKTLYSRIPKNGFYPRLTMRISAAAAGVLSPALFYLNKYFPSPLLSYATAFPTIDIFTGVWVKFEISKSKVDKIIHKFLQSKGVNVSKEVVKALYTAAEGLLAMGLMSPETFGSFVSAAAGIITKEKMRALIDMLWQAIENIEDPIKQRVALAVTYATTVGICAGSALGLKLLGKNSFLNLVFSVLLIPSLDSLIRTVKQTLKVIAEKEETEEQQKPSRVMSIIKNTAVGAGMFGLLGAISFAVGPQIAATAEAAKLQQLNPGLIAVLAGELMVLKVLIARVLSENYALGFSAAATFAGVGYSIFNTDTLSRTYGAVLLLTMITMNLTLYLTRRNLYGKKVPKVISI